MATTTCIHCSPAGASRPRAGSAGAGRALTLVATSLGLAVVQLDVSVVNVAIKPIGASLGGGVSALQWVVNAYTLVFAALILSAGALGDRIGAKRVFVAGFCVFTTASVACGLAPALGVLIAARAVQGAGAAVLVPCSLTLLSHTFPDAQERIRAVGLWAAGASAALSAGPLVGGCLTAAFGWRAIFFINLPIGLAGVALTLRWAAETTRRGDRAVDLPGQAASIAALTVLAAATIEGGSRGFAAPPVLVGFALALAAAVAFVVIESRRAQPMLPLRLFRNPTVSAVALIGLIVNVAFYGLIFVLSLFLQRAQHLSVLDTGLAFAPMTAAIMLANLLAKRLAAATGPRATIAAGAALMAAGAAALLGAGGGAGPDTPYVALLGPFVALGFGLGLIVAVMTAAMLGAVDRSRSGVAAGVLNSARQTGSLIGVALYGALIAGAVWWAGCTWRWRSRWRWRPASRSRAPACAADAAGAPGDARRLGLGRWPAVAP
ncbi:MAG TPA: MFS transporter [Solirubrobacteraceae bacterium]|jgi:DHA2 family methylenomycin A resistance protein-like MFS transporter|nr:MFS transporter [Solirubrobacteraceae bacterium]